MDFAFVPYGQQLGKIMAAMSVLNGTLGSESLTENTQASDTRTPSAPKQQQCSSSFASETSVVLTFVF